MIQRAWKLVAALLRATRCWRTRRPPGSSRRADALRRAGELFPPSPLLVAIRREGEPAADPEAAFDAAVDRWLGEAKPACEEGSAAGTGCSTGQ